jgi:CBS domain-containing protein
MKERDIGDVLVSSGGRLYGIVTDRDLVVRALAEDPTRAADTPLSAICSEAIESVAPDADVGEVIALMEEKAIRRVPVVEEGRPVGIVSLGDLAVARDSESALGKISSAPPTQ